jgi:hypothetical protein
VETQQLHPPPASLLYTAANQEAEQQFWGGGVGGEGSVTLCSYREQEEPAIHTLCT